MTNLKKMRITCHFKLREVAAKVNLTPQTVQQQEKRGIGKTSTAQKYAQALGCNWRDLIDDPYDDPVMPQSLPQQPRI